MKLFKIFLFLGVLSLLFSSATKDARSDDSEREFSLFSVSLPAGWDGEEKTGFVSENPDEYLLTLGKKDSAGDEILAQISVYVLPNSSSLSPEEAAKRLAEAQGDSDAPKMAGKLWTFSGEPRSRIIKGRAVTYANATPEKMLIIIIQDPKNLGADKIFDSLRGTDKETANLLGR